MCSGAYPPDGAWGMELIIWRDRGYSRLFMLHEAEIEGGNRVKWRKEEKRAFQEDTKEWSELSVQFLIKEKKGEWLSR